jgi:hypothetical protein
MVSKHSLINEFPGDLKTILEKIKIGKLHIEVEHNRLGKRL